MFDFTDSQNIGKDYNGFILLSIDDIPDYKTRGVYLRHIKTGLEVYHMLKDDKENLFSFGFRTLSKNSKGTAHIMEHSVLCGSEKFPLKEPFNTLASSCLTTFLNAFTYADKTAYPGASLVRSDYFTMMDVYADAVFFPKLDYETFIQEAHRLEVDENENYSIQGVVYNEMKGNYVNFKQVAYNVQIATMFPNSYPEFDSGGDPLEIPNLTYEDFLDFHQKFYAPNNCCLFLYGDINTADQLDFLNEKVMSRLEKKFNCTKPIANFDSKLPLINPEIQELQKLELQQESKTVHLIAPENGATGNYVSVNYYSGLNDMEKYFLSIALFGNDTAPINIELKNSGLGDEVMGGSFGEYKEELFSIGMFGVKKGNEDKVFDLIKKTIAKVYKNGLSQENIDAAIMNIDLNLREENRWNGPYSLQIMSKVLKGWQRGDSCASQLCPITAFEKVKEKIRTDKNYTKNLIKKYLIDPKVEIRCIIEPSPSFLENRKQKEDALIQKLKTNADLSKLKSDLDKLHKYQQRIETPQETKCIPSTKIQNLNAEIELSYSDLQFIKGADGSDVPLFVSKEDTRGLLYLDVLFPFDNLEPKYFQYIPLLDQVLSLLGWGDKNWEECIAESSCIASDLYGVTYYGHISDCEQCQSYSDKYKKYNFIGRQWIGLSCKTLTSKASDILPLLATSISSMNFDDEKRFNVLLQEFIAEKKANFEPAGYEMALRRASALRTKKSALMEILWGVSQGYTIKGYTKKTLKNDLATLKYMYYECLKQGGIIHITSDDDSLKKVLPLLQNFAKDANITKLLPAKGFSVEDLKPYITQVEKITPDETQLLQIDTQTGYATTVTSSSQYLTKEAAAESVFTTWLNRYILWDKIRTTGGAYGVGAYTINSEKRAIFYTYRDPTPAKSNEIYLEALKEASETLIPKEDIEKIIATCYGDAIIPSSAKDRGYNSFDGMIYANPVEFKKLRVDLLLKVTPEDVQAAAKRLYENVKNCSYKAIFCDKKADIIGKKIDIPL